MLAANLPAAEQDIHHITDRSRFWDYYNPHPSNYIGSIDWWNGNVFLGDWWGIRNMIADDGVQVSLNYTNNIAGNVTGGMSRGFTYTDNIGFGVMADLEKLVNWKGANLLISGLDRNGTSLSQKNIGNQFTVQQVYGGQTAMYFALALEQKMFDDKVSLKLGRFSTGDDFASSPIYWLYMNNGIDGNPQALPVNTQFSAYPWAVWAARLKIEPTKETYAMFGAYQVSNRVFNRSYHGLDWSIRPDDGVLLISQFGWSPEFFKRPVPADAPKVADGGKTASTPTGPLSNGKSFKNPVQPTEMKGMPGNYWFGAYFSPWEFSQFGTTSTARNSYGFYWHMDQMIYQPVAGSDKGLTIWSAFVLSPQQNIAKLPFQVNGGLVYKGLIPCRDNDYTTFGVVYGKFSDNYANASAAAGLGSPDFEMVFELGYRVTLTKFMYVQPNAQWVINPGGTGNIPDALVLGAQVGVTF